MDFDNSRFSLEGKVAVVTGAGGRANNIGRAYAMGLANAGASVVAVDLNEAGAQAVADEIVAQGGRAIGVRADIADRASVDAMAAKVRAEFGGVDILVNNAALMVEVAGATAMQISLEQWNQCFAVNVTGALNCVQALAPMMAERGGGKIVNQISGGAYPPLTVYGVTKLALAGLTTLLAKELGPQKINVNGISPGNTMSQAGSSLTPDESPFIKMLEATVALRVRGTPDELVGALLLLCSPAGDWISGQVINVDGGWIMR
jgi:NAD(P)-dependent dehydrogenase (short-subunit alcohol dehydrogenase family)